MPEGDDFLDSISQETRPEPNIHGNFDCMDCREPVDMAHLDRKEQTITWYCSKGHKSVMKDVGL